MASFGHAFAGLAHVFRTQRNARVHLSIAAVVILAGLVVGLSWLELAIICLAISLVFFAELINTMTETVVDLVTAEYNPLAKVAKDVAAGAVLWTAILSVIVGILVFLPHVARLIGP